MIKVLAILLEIACAVLVPVSGVMALFSFMAFDAPDSGKSPGKWLFVLSLIVAPFTLIAAIYYGWSDIANGAYVAALRRCLLSLIPLAIGLFLLHFDWFDKP